MSDSQAKVSSTVKESSSCVLNDTAQEIIPQIPLEMSPYSETSAHLHSAQRGKAVLCPL